MWLVELGSVALACGGFFCDSVQPVEQTGESVIFEVDGDTITTHARIDYSGPAEEFAWILPAAGVPELFLSSEALFTRLEGETAPQLDLNWQFAAGCSLMSDMDTDSDADSDTDYWSEPVQVLSIQEVGPYEAVVVDASSAESLVEWLQDNGYGVPDNYGEAAAPYVTGGMNFLALKLNKTQSLGALPPLGVRWSGTHPSIPITLTQVAAAENMPLNVFIFGDARAVPLSYLHVQLNPLTYNWFGIDPRWRDGYGRAADEAGGRAFGTEYAGVHAIDWSCPSYSLDGLDEMEVALEWFQELTYRGFSGEPELINVLRAHAPAPQGTNELDFYAYPYAYPYEWAALDATFDPVAATADLVARIIEPCQRVDQMLTNSPYVTRMVSLLSPDEMTVDPVFGFNADLPEVPRIRSAEISYDCSAEQSVITMPGDYTFYDVPTQTTGVPTWDWLDEHRSPAALVIEQLSEQGEGEIIADHREAFRESLVPEQELEGDDLEQTPKGAGCGCDSGSGASLVALGLSALLARRRRFTEL